MKIKTRVSVTFPENPRRKTIYPKLGQDGFYWEDGHNLLLQLDDKKYDTISESCENSIHIVHVKVVSINKSTTIINQTHGEIILEGLMDTKENSYVKCVVSVKTSLEE